MNATRLASVVLIVLGISAPARAEMVGTAQLLGSADAQRVQADAFLAREDVRHQLEALGVSPADAASRVAGMTGAELQALSSRIDSLPAGAAGVSTLGLVLIIVLIVVLI